MMFAIVVTVSLLASNTDLTLVSQLHFPSYDACYQAMLSVHFPVGKALALDPQRKFVITTKCSPV